MMAILVVLLAGCGGSPAPSKTDGSQASAPAAGAPDAAGSPGERGDLADVPEDLVTAKILAPWKGDFDGMQRDGVIRALVVYSKTFYYIDQGDQHGISVEATSGNWRPSSTPSTENQSPETAFVLIIPVRRDQLLPFLAEGRGDLALGNITVTPERQKTVAFSDPVMTGVKEILVTGPSNPVTSNLSDLGNNQEVWVRPSSSYWERLQAANAALVKVEALPPSRSRPPTSNWRTRTSWRW